MLHVQGKTNYEMHILRTIHPIGQGAFYSEHILTDQFRGIVYDCGSGNSKTISRTYIPVLKELSKRLSNNHKDKYTINLLFISHFDADHINGIRELNKIYDIKRIVLPLITPYKWYLYALGANNDQMEAMVDFRAFLDEYKGKLIEVNPINGDSSVGDDGEVIDLESDNAPTQVRSGRKLTLGKYGNGQLFWCYIPMNYEMDSKKIKDLKNAIIKVLPSHDINNVQELGAYHGEIKKAFRDLKIKTNETSMIVYSGLSQPITYKDLNNRFEFGFWYEYGIGYCRERNDNSLREACLYTGDSILDEERCKSVSQILNGLSKNIGTLQIPHHGSKNNFFADAFENNLGKLQNIISFASFGKNSQFGHPSPDVVKDLTLHYSPLWGITEDSCSKFIEGIYLEY